MCKRVEFLVRQLAELREMLVGMKRTVTGHGLEGIAMAYEPGKRHDVRAH